VDNTLDYILSKQLNHAFASSEFLTIQASVFGASGLARLLLAASIVALWFFRPLSETYKFRYRALLILITLLPTYLAARIVQHIFTRPRPIGVMPLEIVGDPEVWRAWKDGIEQAGSFPSDHAALFFIFVTVLWSLNRKIGIISLALAAYFCMLRVVLGFHWSSDILGGAALGYLVATLILKFEQPLKGYLHHIVNWVESRRALCYSIAFIFLADLACGFDLFLEGIVFKLLKIFLHIGPLH